jgi:hypothetical protein
MVLTVTSCSPRGPGSFVPVIPEKLASQELDTSVGVSGPHDFAVRFKRRSSRVAKASTASHPAFVTTRTPLLSRPDGAENTQFLIFRNRNICAWRADKPNQLESAREIRFCAHAFWRCWRPSARRERHRIDQTDSPVGQNGISHTAVMPPAYGGIQYAAASRSRIDVSERMNWARSCLLKSRLSPRRYIRRPNQDISSSASAAKFLTLCR